MEMPSVIISGIFNIIFLFIIFIIPLILTALNVINLFKKDKIKESSVDRTILFLGSFLTIWLLAILSCYRYDEPVVMGDIPDCHEPFSEDYMIWLIVPAVLGFIGMFKLIGKKVRSPIATVLYTDFVIIGMIISVLYIIQIFPHITELFYAYLCLLSFNYILCGIRLIRDNIKIYLDHMNKCCNVPKSRFIMKLQQNFSDIHKLPLIIFIMLIPLIAVMFAILVLCEQGADGFIKLFTQTADWTFSQQIPPPPVEYQGHYLCTVAAGGHEKIVKPQRIGYRQHTKIIVNRQLCIANAFEQLIEEKFPKIHKFIRHNYNKYGYPLSKHITTPLRADIVYIAMKPLEWFFLIVLYLFDITPEKRISVQYTKK